LATRFYSIKAQTKKLAIKQTQVVIATAQKQLIIFQKTKPHIKSIVELSANPIFIFLPPTQNNFHKGFPLSNT